MPNKYYMNKYLSDTDAVSKEWSKSMHVENLDQTAVLKTYETLRLCTALPFNDTKRTDKLFELEIESFIKYSCKLYV